MKRRWLPLAFLLVGGAGVAYLASAGPRDQHVRLVLGDRAGIVESVAVAYETPSGEAVRDVRLTYGPTAGAPRVLALEPRLPSAEYRLRIEIDTREGRRTTERQVTLGGGTTSVDLTGVLGDKRTIP